MWKVTDPFSRDTIPKFSSTSTINEGGGKNNCAGGNKGDAKKGSDSSSAKRTKVICELNFHSPEENLNNLNSYVEYNHFKMEGLFLLNELLEEGDDLCKLDLKDVYFSVLLRQNSQSI